MANHDENFWDFAIALVNAKHFWKVVLTLGTFIVLGVIAYLDLHEAFVSTFLSIIPGLS